ncbi:MAG: type I polyketide synthase, partial [bacterium]|nr:type I polyketide synthase [bacterium]
SLEGIVRVTAEALAVSGVDPATLGFLEAHGTGTDLGDSLEIDALTRVFRTYTDAKQYCHLGSVKSNFGHLDTAAGVASLAKATMALEHAKIPPTVNFEEPNPNIPFATSPFKVNGELVDWPAPEGDHPRRAAVNVFAIGGTNVYLVLEEAPPPLPCDPPRPWQLLTLSARTTTALYNARVRLSEHLEEHPELELADVAYTLQVGRKAFPMRQTLLCRDRQDALEMLANPNPQRSWSGSFSDGRPVVLLLSGAGEWGDLVPALCELEPEFRREIESCCEQARSQLNLDLRPGWLDGDASQDESEAVTRARGFVAGCALARLWLAWGIVPQGLFGLGAGEPLAACLAGVLPFADALALALGSTPEGLGREPLESPRWSLLSPVTGGWLSAEEVTDPAYWSAPERDAGLDQALGELCNNSDSVLLEVGPAAILDRIEEHADFTYEQTTVALDQGAAPPAALLTLLGRVWTAGVDVDWRAVYEHHRRRRVELPTYPFERERFWIDPPREEAAAAPRRDASTRRPLAEWFYAPTWQGRYLSGPISGLDDGECWLVLSDGSSLAAQIGQQLAEADENVVTVR